MPDDREPFDIPKTTVDRGGTVRTLMITARRLRAGERGQNTWPRFRWDGDDCLVIKTRAWPGDRSQVKGEPLITWTFSPIITATGVHGISMDIRRVQHILDDAGFTWPTSGRPGKREAEIRAVVDPIVRRLKSERIDPTEENVLKLLPPNKRGQEIHLRTLQRWINGTLRMTWGAYVDSVEPENS